VFPIQEVLHIHAAFGATNTDKLMPAYSDIPEEFKNFNRPTKWNKLVSEMFFFGLKSLKLTPKAGVDKDKAMKHIRSVLTSWVPKHEHKEAGCSFLFNEWFEDAQWEANEPEKTS
jgi:hypothetical protein